MYTVINSENRGEDLGVWGWKASAISVAEELTEKTGFFHYVEEIPENEVD